MAGGVSFGIVGRLGRESTGSLLLNVGSEIDAWCRMVRCIGVMQGMVASGAVGS